MVVSMGNRCPGLEPWLQFGLTGLGNQVPAVASLGTGVGLSAQT